LKKIKRSVGNGISGDKEMNGDTTNILGVIPPIFVGGALMLLTERFINQPYNKRKKTKRFDEQEYKDLKLRKKNLGFGDFSNIG